MSPIEGVSEVRQFPRLGKLHLGIKVEKPGRHPYPSATDYIVVPDEIKQYTGEKPKKLNIIFPTDNPEDFAPQFLKRYSLTQGLVCRGDGKHSRRKTDTNTGAIADHKTEHWEYTEMSCDPEHCEEMLAGNCRRVMNLMFALPDIPGLGVWQLDTSSFFSIVNINSCLDILQGLFGRIAGIPLLLSLEPREVTPPGIKKKTIHVLHLRSNLKLADLRRKILAIQPPRKIKEGELKMPAAEEEEPPEDLFPGQALAEQEGLIAETPPAEVSPVPGIPPPDRIKPRAEWDKITQVQIPDYPHLLPLIWELGHVQPEQLYQIWGVTHYSKIPKTAWEAFLILKEKLVPAGRQEKLV